MTEPAWLAWASEVQAIGQTGLKFARDPYDRDRYAALLALAARMMTGLSDADPAMVLGLFAAQV